VLVTRLLAGGQTGADRTALDVAQTLGLPYAGWCPPGGWAEDLPAAPGVLARYPDLRETPTGSPDVRTRWNVRDSDATLVLTLLGASSPGTRLTLEVAGELGRPSLVALASDVVAVTAWLRSLPEPVVLNVAGPRESEAPGLYGTAYRTLLEALR